jgi:hypothetical protein
MKSFISRVWVCLPASLMILGVGTARADIIFNSLDQTTNAGFYSISSNVTSPGPVASSFLTGASASTLTSVDVYLFDPSGASSGSFQISLFSNSGSNTPGTLLETLATPSDSILPNAGTFGSFTYSGLSTLLAPNTEYWIELSSTNSALGWEGTDNTSGIGVISQYTYDSGSFSNAIVPPGPNQMTVTTAPINSMVPEPSSIIFLGTAVFLVVRKRIFPGRSLDT